MKLSPVHKAVWASFLVLWAHRSSQSEAETLDSHLCKERNLVDAQRYNKSSGQTELVHDEDVDEIFSCLLYPTNTLNCSWSLPSLPGDSQVSGAVIICEDKKGLPSWKYSSEEVPASEEGVRSKSVALCRGCINYNKLSVIVRVNVSLPNVWTVYTKKYKSVHMLEVLSPPPNITALVKDGGLLVTWDQPSSFIHVSRKCFEYQLDISGQEGPKNVEKQLNYTEPNADPTHTYRVRMRTRKNLNTCRGNQLWSDWSQFVTVGPSEPPYRLNSVVIITISLGIPMILLAVLLFFRLQRVSELLFPPIPRPSIKYKNFLEKTDAFLFSPPAQPPKYEEEITEVEEAE